MANTLTEVEVKKTTTNTNDTRQMTAPAFEGRSQRSRKTFVLAPLALLVTGAATFLVVRRWLNQNGCWI
ncbi:MAG: hypothetical protein ABI234_15530 [Ktedonobacteraceae bacterium]